MSTFCVTVSHHKNQVETRFSQRRRTCGKYTFARRDLRGAANAADAQTVYGHAADAVDMIALNLQTQTSADICVQTNHKQPEVALRV